MTRDCAVLSSACGFNCWARLPPPIACTTLPVQVAIRQYVAWRRATIGKREPLGAHFHNLLLPLKPTLTSPTSFLYQPLLWASTSSTCPGLVVFNHSACQPWFLALWQSDFYVYSNVLIPSPWCNSLFGLVITLLISPTNHLDISKPSRPVDWLWATNDKHLGNKTGLRSSYRTPPCQMSPCDCDWIAGWQRPD